MRLHPEARELAHWPLTNASENLTLEVTFDGDTWHPLTRDGDTATALVAGPDAIDSTDEPPGTIVLQLGRNHCLIRALDHPEIPYRAAGTIDVKA